jgi:hypothetical protein
MAILCCNLYRCLLWHLEGHISISKNPFVKEIAHDLSMPILSGQIEQVDSTFEAFVHVGTRLSQHPENE